MRAPFLVWGLGTGAFFSDKLFIYLYPFMNICLLTPMLYFFIVHKQLNSVYGFRGKSFPRVKALAYQTFGVPIDDVGQSPQATYRD